MIFFPTMEVRAAVAFFGAGTTTSKLAVARILGDGKRQRTRVFTELQSHYLFEDRFGRPGKGNDKGKVRDWSASSGGTSWNPVPQCRELRGPQRCSRRQCRARARLGGHKETIGERLERDRQVAPLLLPILISTSSLSWGAPTIRPVIHREVLIWRVFGEADGRSLIFDLRCIRAEDRPRPGRAVGGLGPARGLHHSAAAPRSSYGQGRQARVRPGAPSTGDLPARGGRGCGLERRPAARRNRL